MPASTYARFTAAPAAVTNRFVVSTNMVNGNYTVANTTQPTAGARKIVATITGVTGNDTPGTLTIVGTGANGQAKTEVLTLVAGGTATSAGYFLTIATLTQAGWVINGGNDTIVVGCDASQVLLDGSGGKLYAIIVNTTAAGTVTVADARGTIAQLKSSIAEGHYLYGPGIDCAGILSVTQTAASDITVIYDVPTAS